MTVTEAAELAKKHLVSVWPDYGANELELEELDTPPIGSKWSFTFSTTRPVKTDGVMNLSDILRGRRVSKSVEINPEDGSLLSIRNAAV